MGTVWTPPKSIQDRFLIRRNLNYRLRRVCEPSKDQGKSRYFATSVQTQHNGEWLLVLRVLSLPTCLKFLLGLGDSPELGWVYVGNFRDVSINLKRMVNLKLFPKNRIWRAYMVVLRRHKCKCKKPVAWSECLSFAWVLLLLTRDQNQVAFCKIFLECDLWAWSIRFPTLKNVRTVIKVLFWNRMVSFRTSQYCMLHVKLSQWL